MQVQLLVERDQNECIVKLAGTAYTFKRNEHGHLVADISDQETIKWVSDPMHNTSFKPYSVPKKNTEDRMSAHFGNEIPQTVVETGLRVPEGAPEGELVDKQIFDSPKVVHTEEWLCQICGKPFGSEKSLKGHVGGAHKKGTDDGSK